MYGTVPDGHPALPATARFLDADGTARVQDLMRRRFFLYRLVRLADRALRRELPLVALALALK
ncbi:hypothetical protein ACIP10_30500 [Streptomyces galbus]|uniref:hypothetical protein n=1 Tax=Streptomyces galbus TaxID=33898 RepID=UPI0037AAD550